MLLLPLKNKNESCVVGSYVLNSFGHAVRVALCQSARLPPHSLGFDSWPRHVSSLSEHLVYDGDDLGQVSLQRQLFATVLFATVLFATVLATHRGGTGSIPGQDMSARSRDIQFTMEMTLVKSLHSASSLLQCSPPTAESQVLLPAKTCQSRDLQFRMDLGQVSLYWLIYFIWGRGRGER